MEYEIVEKNIKMKVVDENMKKKIVKIIVMVLLTILLILNFYNNFLGDKRATLENITFETFENFQNDSEYLVYSEIFQNKYGIDPDKYGLAEVVDQENKRTENIEKKISNYDPKKGELTINRYISQYGLQGHIFSFFYNKLHIPFFALKLI